MSIILKKKETSSKIKTRNIMKIKEMMMKTYPNKKLLYTLSLNFSSIYNFRRLQNITNLILSNSNISSLPMELGLLPFLRRIDLSHNDLVQSKWTWLEQAAIKKKLIDLDISDNSLTELPLQIVKLNTLKYLKACFNKLRRLPQSICMLENLEYLHLSHNKLEILPASLKFLGLKFLDISKNLLIKKYYFNFSVQINSMFVNSLKKVWKIPTLQELSAKIILRSRIPYDTNLQIPLVFVKYLDEANYCCICKEACIDVNEKIDISIHPMMLRNLSKQIQGISMYDYIKLESYVCSLFCSKNVYRVYY